ncbi:hypothetical protein PP707_05195 [Acetobacter pasteurianus]|nr:hypothetical protein [Acetobacter pasteurianus]
MVASPFKKGSHKEKNRQYIFEAVRDVKGSTEKVAYHFGDGQ